MREVHGRASDDKAFRGIGLQSVEKERDRVEERSACARRETDSVELGISTHVKGGGR